VQAILPGADVGEGRHTEIGFVEPGIGVQDRTGCRSQNVSKQQIGFGQIAGEPFLGGQRRGAEIDRGGRFGRRNARNQIFLAVPKRLDPIGDILAADGVRPTRYIGVSRDPHGGKACQRWGEVGSALATGLVVIFVEYNSTHPEHVKPRAKVIGPLLRAARVGRGDEPETVQRVGVLLALGDVHLGIGFGGERGFQFRKPVRNLARGIGAFDAKLPASAFPAILQELSLAACLDPTGNGAAADGRDDSKSSLPLPRRAACRCRHAGCFQCCFGAPPSNAATTSRPSTRANPNKSGLHSVGIGALRESRQIVAAQQLSLIRRPDALSNVRYSG
jgi:hypothetical protein